MKNSKNSFKVGSNIVYPSHGIGKITKIEEQTIGGVALKLLLIYFEKEKLSLRIPVNKAEKTGLRAIISNKNMKEVISILSEKPKPHRGIWSKRAIEYEAKINSGDLLLIAEVIRDLYKNTNNTDRSYSEKVIYDSALERLSSEYALLHNMDEKAALEEIMEIIREKQTA